MLCLQILLEVLHPNPHLLHRNLHRTQHMYQPTKLLEEHALAVDVVTEPGVQRAATDVRLITTVFPRVLTLAGRKSDRVAKVEAKAQNRSLCPWM